MTAEETNMIARLIIAASDKDFIDNNLSPEEYRTSLHGHISRALLTYGLQKQNEVLDKAADIVDRSYDFRTCEWQPCQQSILNLKNKL